MRNIGSKKRFAIIASTVAAVLIGSGVAVAFWTTTGTGSGSAATGDSSTLTITQTSPITDLYPGGPPVDIDLNIANPNVNPQSINTVDVSIVSIAPVGCTAGNFTVTDATIAGFPNNVPAGPTNAYLGATTGAEITLVESGSNQDICKNAVVTLGFTTT